MFLTWEQSTRALKKVKGNFFNFGVDFMGYLVHYRSMNVMCTLDVESNSLTVFRVNCLVATVKYCGGEQPEITLFAGQDKLLTLTLGDLEIIQDNWSQLQELRESAKKC